MQNKFRNYILDRDICCSFNKGSRITSIDFSTIFSSASFKAWWYSEGESIYDE